MCVLISGEYDEPPIHHIRVDLQITDSKGHVAFARESIDDLQWHRMKIIFMIFV